MGFQGLIQGLNNFIKTGHNASGTASIFSKVLSGTALIMTESIELSEALSDALKEGLTSAMDGVVEYFGKMMKEAIGFDLSLEGMLDQAEKTRKYFSELADEMNFYSSSTGSTTKAMGMLLKATSKSTAGIQTLRGAFSSMVDAGADSDEFISDMLPLLGDFETKTGIGAQQFATMSTKFQQMFGEKKGITKDIQDLQKALIGTGLKGAQLEQTMQGLTEAAEKLAFTTQGATLNIKELSKSYGKTTAVFKAFGISAQTTSSFLNGLVDPENIEKNMLLMNKMGISYQEFNEMLNSGQGQDKFFDKILNNVGKVAQEANMIQDAGTRYKYLKDTLGLPPEIANKLMKVTPSRMQSELRKIKREMEDAEKRDKWRKELKAREEKYEESMNFLRMQMVAPLVSIINKNRDSIRKFMQNLTPLVELLATKLVKILEPLANWFSDFVDDIKKLSSGEMSFSAFVKIHMEKFLNSFGDTIKGILNDPEFRKIGPMIIDGILEGIKMYQAGKTNVSNQLTNMALDAAGDALVESDSLITKTLGYSIKAGNVYTKSVNKFFGAIGNYAEDYLAEDIKNASKLYIPETGRAEAADWSFRSNELGNISSMGLQTSDKDSWFDNTVADAVSDLKDAATQGKGNEVREKLKSLNDALMLKNKGNEKQVFAYMSSLSNKLLTGVNPDDPNAPNTVSPQQVNAIQSGVNNIIQTNQEAAQATADLANKKLSEAEVAAAVQKLMSNKEFVAAVTASLSKEKDDKINALDKQIMALTNSEAQLKKEFENLKKESVPAILKQWEQFLFGNNNNSILNVLVQSRDILTENNEILKKSRGSSGRPGQTDIAAFDTAVGSNPNITGSSLIKNAMSNNVKSLQVKQTMFLKSIADATLDSAQVLRYIGKNLIFTPSGLGVNTGVAGYDNKVYAMAGTAAGKDEIVSGFGVVKKP
jgi:hypothetical protein